MTLIMLIHVVDLENYSLIGDWMDFQHPAVTAMITPSAEELSVYGPRNNKTVYVQGVPKKMFPCLRGYNSCKKGATVKSKVSFEILRQFSF